MMLALAISLSAILIYLTAAYGFGRLAIDRFYKDSQPGWAFTTVVGLSLWIFLGGLLNAGHLAFPLALDMMIGLGLGLAIGLAYPSINKHRITVYCQGGRARFREAFPHWLISFLIGVTFVFLVFTLMPAGVFNFHDDLYIYMARPLRMLQTGSLGGNPFEVLGSDSLGAQAFLQSFFVNRLSLGYINGFDAISCFVLSLFLLRDMGRRFGIHWAFVLASLLIFVVIHPQYVNTSALYSGTLMILATVFVSIVFADDMGGADSKRAFAGAAAVALCLASLIALKTTFAIFAVTYFLVYFGCALYIGFNRPRVLLSMLFVVLAAVFWIIPWILVSLPNYATALKIARDGNPPAVAGGWDGLTVFMAKIVTVFSVERAWGGHFLTYSLLASLLAVIGVTTLFRRMKSGDAPHRQGGIALSAACVAAAISYFANVYLLDPENAVRYSVPILIAVASMTSLLLVQNRPPLPSKENRDLSIIASAGGVAILGVAGLMAAVFSGDLVNRIQRAYELRTLLSFHVDETDSRLVNAVMAKSTGAWVVSRQHKTEKGQAILAFMTFPFHLDYARNPIFIVNESVFLTPWSDFPLNTDPETARGYLSDRGIRYVMYQYRGPYVRAESELRTDASSPYGIYRKLAQSNLRFRGILRYLVENSLRVDTSPGFVTVDISQRTLSPPSIPWPAN